MGNLALLVLNDANTFILVFADRQNFCSEIETHQILSA